MSLSMAEHLQRAAQTPDLHSCCGTLAAFITSSRSVMIADRFS